jgi:hypothetical protein
MSYIDHNLMKGENVIHRARLHWIIFSSPALHLALGICFLAIGFRVHDNISFLPFMGGLFIPLV